MHPRIAGAAHAAEDAGGVGGVAGLQGQLRAGRMRPSASQRAKIISAMALVTGSGGSSPSSWSINAQSKVENGGPSPQRPSALAL